MKQTQVDKLRKYVEKHPIFTIRDVHKVTNANNPYDVLLNLKRETMDIWYEDVKNKNGVRFRVFWKGLIYEYYFNRYLRKHNLELA